MDNKSQVLKATIQGQGQQIVVGAICVVLTMLLVTWLTQRRDAAIQKLPPGPKGWPILGALPLLSGPIHETLYKLSTKYGPLMGMHLGFVHTLVISNARMAKEVCKTNDRVMASRWGFKIISYLFYNGQDFAFAPYGDHWRKIRKICTLELFTTSHMNRFQDQRRHEINRMVQSLFEEAQRGNSIQVLQFFEKMTMNTMTQMMWNKRHRTYGNTSSTDKVDDMFIDLFHEILALMAVNNIGDFIPLLNWISLNLRGYSRRMSIAHQKLDDFLEEILRAHKQQRSLSTEGVEKISSNADFVDVLLNRTMQSETDQYLSEQTIKGTLTNLLVGGTDTSATSLEWALAELIKNPCIMRRVQDELSSVVGPDRLVNEDDIPKLQYLNAVLRETLRLHPPTPLSLPRASIADCKIDGFHVPGGSLVFINLWAIHRDPEMWDKPLEFYPERFLDQQASAEVDWNGQHFNLIPFGAGRRICPAASLASSILHLALAQLLHCMEWSLPGEQKPEDLDMTEAMAFVPRKEVSLVLTAKPRLSSNFLISAGP